MAISSLLVGDIGGTNARFALADTDDVGFSQECTLKCADFDSADAAIKSYLESIGAPSPAVVCLAAAGPIVDETVTFTNNHWVIDAAETRADFGIDMVQVMNDFEAIAYSIPLLGDDDFLPVGLPESQGLDDDYLIGVVGPGTGLGAVGLRSRGGKLTPIPGEASHGGFAPETAVQLEILKTLRERFDRVSSERLVSGQGVENIYWALTKIHGEQRAQLSASEIFAVGIDNSDLRAAEAVQMFFEVLGQFAGDLALALSANDGIYIGGGIAKRYPDVLANSRFRNGFERKGRYRAQMERIPTQLIMHEEPGLLGASYCARQFAESG